MKSGFGQQPPLASAYLAEELMKLIQHSPSFIPSCADPGVKLAVMVDRFRSVKTLVQGVVEGAELVARQLDDGFGTVSIYLRDVMVGPNQSHAARS